MEKQNFNAMGQQQNPENLRENLANKVHQDLEKYKDRIIQFNLLTCSGKANGFWDTNNSVKPVRYDERYKEVFEFHNYTAQDYTMQAEKSGYIYDTEENKVTFSGILGTGPGMRNRDGNGLYTTLKFEKNFKDHQELLSSIATLFDSLQIYHCSNHPSNESGVVDMKGIAKEALITLKAFEDISEKFPSDGRISVKFMIKEYEEILNS